MASRGPSPRPEDEDLVVVGRVARPHGLSGEVAVDLSTDFPDRFVEGLGLLLRLPDGAVRATRVESVRPHGGRLLVRLDVAPDAESAEGLRGGELCVRGEEVAERPEGFYYHFDLAGCGVFDPAGRRLGTVRDLVEVGGRHLLEVDTPRGARDVPFVAPIVVSVSVDEKRVVLDPPEGLLE